MVNKLIEQGLRQHRADRLAEAKNRYEQVLALVPQNPDARRVPGLTWIIHIQSIEQDRLCGSRLVGGGLPPIIASLPVRCLPERVPVCVRARTGRRSQSGTQTGKRAPTTVNFHLLIDHFETG